MKLGDDDRLYLIVGSDRSSRRVADVVAQASVGGARLIQIREKSLPHDPYVSLVKQCRDATQSVPGVRLLVNRHADIALASGADGVHLPGDASIASARRALGDGCLIGYSAHDVDGVLRAEAEGADLVTLSPIFPTRSKPGVPPIGVDAIRQCASQTQVPILALGGIGTGRIAECMRAGAFGVAVMGAVLDSDDVAGAVAQCFLALRSALQCGDSRIPQ